MTRDGRSIGIEEVRETLGEGDRLPSVKTAPPGPRSKELSKLLERHEAPGINTLIEGEGLLWEAARGANVLDVDGNRYVDLTAGFGAAGIGHAHPDVAAAVRAQSDRLVHGLGDVHAHPGRVELARRLADWVPIDDPTVYFAISGSDGIEIALKTALLATGRRGVLAFRPAYHGLTLGALSVTSRAHFREPFELQLRSDVRHLPFAGPIEAVRSALETRELGAVVLEPIVGREGVLVPPPGWLSAVAAAAEATGTLFVVDEVLTGFGRTGARFAVDREGVRPDLLVCGKALGGGLPIGVVAGRREVMAAWAEPGEARHTATFVGHPLASAAALAALEVLERERLGERAEALGWRIAERVAAWPDRFACCRDVRGVGLLWGIELDGAESAREAVRRLLGRGYLALAGGPDGAVLELTPPLSIREAQLDGALGELESILAG